jgi:polyadenylate-binding protein
MGPQQGGRRMGAPGGPGGPGRGGMGGPGNMGPPRGYPPQQQMRQGGPPPPNVKYTNQVRNQPPMQMGGPPMGHPMHVQQQPHPNMPRPSDGLDHNALAQADFSTQKNMIGEKLYPLVMLHQPEFAGKITGMLLEMDNAELLHLLESPEALQSKVHEAMTVLQQHNQG